MRGFTEHYRRTAITFVVFAAITLSVVLLVAVLAVPGDDTPAAVFGSDGASVATHPPSPVVLPDLNDPCVRQEFAKSFEAGYFGTPAPSGVARNAAGTDPANDTCTPRLGRVRRTADVRAVTDGGTPAAAVTPDQAVAAGLGLRPGVGGVGAAGRLPNLDDPATRRRFVCNFAPGSFGIPPQLSRHVPGRASCAGSAATNP